MQPANATSISDCDTGGTRHAAVRHLPDQILQQRRFAYTRFPAKHQCSALARPNSRGQPGEHLALPAPVE